MCTFYEIPIEFQCRITLIKSIDCANGVLTGRIRASEVTRDSLNERITNVSLPFRHAIADPFFSLWQYFNNFTNKTKIYLNFIIIF